MIINAEALSAVFTGLKTSFVEAVEGTETDAIERLMSTVPSSGAAEDFPVGTLLGDLEEVLDEVTITNIGVWLQTITNRTYARIVQVRRNDIADDNVGVYKPSVRQLGRRAALYPLRLAAEAFVAGFTEDWIDDELVFYAAARTWPGIDSPHTWQNREDLALTADNLTTAIQAMEERVDPIGVPLGLSPDLLICGPSNRAAAEGILQTQYLANGGSNRHYQRCDLEVIPRITGDHWAIVDTTPIQPMVLLDREGPDFTAKESATDDDAFYRERYAYKARRRCAVGIVGPWLFQASNGG